MDVLSKIANTRPDPAKLRRVKRWQIVRDGRGSMRLYELRQARVIVDRYNRIYGEASAYLSVLVVTL